MKISITQSELLKPLQALKAIASGKTTLTICNHLHIEATGNQVVIRATDLTSQLTWRFEDNLSIQEEGATTVPAGKLFDICKNFGPDEQLKLRVDPSTNQANLHCGRSKFKLQSLPVEEFPSMADEQRSTELYVKVKPLKTLFDRTQYALAKKDVRHYLQGLYLTTEKGQLTAVGTDGHRLATSSITVEPDSSVGDYSNGILPRVGAQEIGRLLGFCDSEDTICLGIGIDTISMRGHRFDFASKKLSGQYPDYKRVIPQGLSAEAIIDRHQLIEAVRRTAILSHEKSFGIALTFDEGQLSLLSNNADQERADETLPIQYSNASGFEIGFNANYILDAVEHLDSNAEEVRFRFNVNPNASIIVEAAHNPDSLSVLMPMRL